MKFKVLNKDGNEVKSRIDEFAITDSGNLIGLEYMSYEVDISDYGKVGTDECKYNVVFEE